MGEGFSIREPEGVVEIGGLIDESRITLGIHGDDLDPDEVSAILKCAPTKAHRRGDLRPRNTPPWPRGAWLLSVEGKAPTEPEDILTTLLDRLPEDPTIWDSLCQRFTVRLGFGLFLHAWNRGFDLSPTVLRRAAATGAILGFDIYADGDEDDD